MLSKTKYSRNFQQIPSFDTSASVVRALIASRLKMLGMGIGTGTLFNNISRGIAIA